MTGLLDRYFSLLKTFPRKLFLFSLFSLPGVVVLVVGGVDEVAALFDAVAALFDAVAVLFDSVTVAVSLVATLWESPGSRNKCQHRLRLVTWYKRVGTNPRWRETLSVPTS